MPPRGKETTGTMINLGVLVVGWRPLSAVAALETPTPHDRSPIDDRKGQYIRVKADVVDPRPIQTHCKRPGLPCIRSALLVALHLLHTPLCIRLCLAIKGVPSSQQLAARLHVHTYVSCFPRTLLPACSGSYACL
ncbi:hypothetical protein B0H66DRAFT_320314 [Apodospora peruviana]|uniref:Secreted protein n=1 Tax=Apodospora peruviana TaxID=516989 RepID=A0AAE0M0M6_9PEZI|nr:hypothetical protein B0H66DRAFT_320314 [Apodospora peruviana]